MLRLLVLATHKTKSGLKPTRLQIDPNKGEFTIKLNSSSNQDINVDIFDIRGRKIFNEAYVNNSDFNQIVRLNSIQSGIYLVKVSDEKKELTKKIVIE